MSSIENDIFRERVCAWLRANRVDPGRIPLYAQASITNGALTVDQKVQVDGHDQVDPEDPGRILTFVTSYPVLVEPDKEVAEWLRPKCPTCGR